MERASVEKGNRFFVSIYLPHASQGTRLCHPTRTPRLRGPTRAPTLLRARRARRARRAPRTRPHCAHSPSASPLPSPPASPLPTALSPALSPTLPFLLHPRSAPTQLASPCRMMPYRVASVDLLPKELLELVFSHLQPFDLTSMATTSHLFHSLSMEAILKLTKRRGFDLPAGGGSVRSLCLAVLMCESSPPALVAVAARHSFFIDGDGALFCSGRSFDSARGILGQGRTALLSTPTCIPSLGGQRVVSVTTSEGSALAIAANGSLWSWGNGAHGRLGHGDTERLFTPTRIEALCGNRFVAVSAASFYSLALDADGVVWGWGLLPGQAQLQLLPKKIDFKLPVIAISAGKQRSIVLTADGCVWSWGCGGDGILGHGDSCDQLCPKRVCVALSPAAVIV